MNYSPLSLLFVLYLGIVGQTVIAHTIPTYTLEDVEQQLQHHPDDVALLLDKARFLQKSKRFEESQEVLKHLDEVVSPRPSDAYYLWVISKWRTGDLEAAVQWSDQSVSQYPKDFNLWQLRGQVLLDANRFDAAIAAFSNSLKFDTSDSYRGYIFIARLLIDRDIEGDKVQALHLLHQVIGKLGDLSELHHMCLDLALELERYEVALVHADALIANYGKQLNFINQRAEILDLMGENEEAIKAYQDLLSFVESMQLQGPNSEEYDYLKASAEASIARLQAL